MGLTPYSIGQPTDEEQLYLEYINRSRANPPAEGQRLATTTDPDVLSAYSSFSVDLALMQSQFDAIPAVPPLAMNAKLMAAARLHSGDMFTNNYQGHNGTDGSDPGTRITAQGYSWSSYGENVFAYSKSVFYGHAGFNVDWGGGLGGMQDPPGHRENIHSSSFREVGVGVVDGSNGGVGPQLVTQDFGRQSSATPFIVGVVYYDFNGNGFYDIGEGIGGVKVDSPNSAYYAITPDSGGYALPVIADGNYTLTFSAPGLNFQTVATISSQRNVKVDYAPVYTPPVISGPNPASVNQTNTYTFTSVGGATRYEWQEAAVQPYTTVEGAENGLGNMTANTSAGYSVVVSDVFASGTHSFHLAHPQPPTDQFLTLNPSLRLSAASQLSFSKRLGYSGLGEVARAQVSTDGGTTWADVWSQTGSGSSGESAFSTVTVPLGTFAGSLVNVRFVYEFHSGTYFPQTSTGVGLYLDNIAISGADLIQAPVASNIPSGNSFGFYPTNTGSYLLAVRAHINNRTLAWGPSTTVTVTAAPPVVQILSKPSVSAGQMQLEFTVANWRSGTTLQLWKAGAVNGTWSQDTSALLQTLTPNSKFRFTTPIGSATAAFYRVKAKY